MEYLFPKDQSGNYIKNGTWGGFNHTDVDFIFKGYYLNPETSYTLIRTSGFPLATCLSFGIADEKGDLALFGDLVGDGTEVWLVLSNDISCNTDVIAGGHEQDYLYSQNPIFEATI